MVSIFDTQDLFLQRKKNIPKVDRIEQIKYLFNKGITNEEDIAFILGVSKQWVRVCGIEVGIFQKEYEKLTRNEEKLLDDLILTGGFSLFDLARKFGKTRQGIMYNLRNRNKMEIYKEKKEKYSRDYLQLLKEREEEEKLKNKKILLEILIKRMFSLGEDNWVETRFLNYYFDSEVKRRFDPIFAKKVHKFLELYCEARSNDEGTTIDKLASDSDISKVSGFVILNRLNEPTLIRNYFSNEDEKILEELFNTEFSSADIAYFLNREQPVIFRKFKKIGERPMFVSRPSKRKLSMIYKKSDEGKNVAEIAEEVGENPLKIERAIDNRNYNERKIIHLLDIIDSNETHTKPYF